MIKIFNYNNFVKLISIILVLGFFVFILFSSQAANSSSDAIAIRVIPNPNHYSALRWYNEQEFYGSPQSLTVDGYESVRDGRTVYVNAANISLGHLYTNIYLISYNQKAESATVDIFSQILSHWQFNTNITALGHCRYAAINEDNVIPCLRDNECLAGDFCDSAKARIIRDTRRLADLAEIKFILDNYKIVGYYPILGAGTYLPHKTLSVWPSWQETLGSELKVTLPQDPVNKLGDCPGYNEITCWDEETKQFAEAFPDLPDNSLAYTYTTDVNGTQAEVCAVFESGLILTGSPACFLTGVCLDFDEDGWGIYDSGACPEVGADCDDTNPLIHAALGPEICDNGVDDDCDGLTDCNDNDCDLHPACSAAMCVPDGVCNGICPFNCSGSILDPDCNCLPDIFICCGLGCTHAQDPDCPEVCAPDGCNSVCPAGCTVAEDPDCGCENGDGCCGPGCNISNDDNCLPECVDIDGDNHYMIDILCPAGDDCDDNDLNNYPGNAEVCDGIDNNCNLISDEGLSEEDCAFVCLALSPLYDYNAGRNGDLRCCGNDLGEDNPYEVTEVSCSDGNDNDCDGFCDDALDACYSGSLPDSDCPGVSCSDLSEDDFQNMNTPGDCNQCYNLDNNPFKAGDNEGDQEPSAFGRNWSDYALEMADLCDSDCNSSLFITIHIDQYEDGTEVTCDDGIDNDCDGNVDCADSPDCDIACCIDTCSTPSQPNCQAVAPSNSQAGVGICCNPAESCYQCQAGFIWDSFDCVVTCEDKDHDFYSTTGSGNCCGPANNQPCNLEVDCDDTRSYIYPGASETCDGFDNDCDTQTDEGCDDDNDGYCDDTMTVHNAPIAICPNTNVPDGNPGDDCDDNDINIHPGAIELCDSIDNDCNAATADGSGEPAPLNSNQVGICVGSQQTCSGGVWVDYYLGIVGYEQPESTCNDSFDNDCDGDTDCDDPDCIGGPFCLNNCAFTFTFPCVFP